MNINMYLLCKAPPGNQGPGETPPDMAPFDIVPPNMVPSDDISGDGFPAMGHGEPMGPDGPMGPGAPTPEDRVLNNIMVSIIQGLTSNLYCQS